MAELESVMTRLSAHTQRLKLRSAAMDDDDERRLMAESLALVSEAVLKVGRDVRQIRAGMSANGQSLD